MPIINPSDPRYQKFLDLRNKQFTAGVFGDLKNELKVLFYTLDQKLKVLNSSNEQLGIILRDFIVNLKRTLTGQQESSQKLVEEVTDRLVDMENSAIDTAEKNSDRVIEAITSIDIPEVVVPESVSVKNLQNLEGSLQTLEKALKDIYGKEIKFPQIQKVAGSVDVANLPKIPQLDDISLILQTISNLLATISKIKQPEIKIPDFPKQIRLDDQNIVKELVSLREELEAIKNKETPQFPNEIAVTNFPIPKYPLPVTNINILPLVGIAQSTAVTVGDSATALPATPVESRRSLTVYNNSSSTVFIGGSGVTTANGLPIASSQFSPTIDAGVKMLIYGIVSSGT